MDFIGLFGDVIINSASLIFCGALLLKAISDITAWTQAYEEKEVLFDSHVIHYVCFSLLTTSFSIFGITLAHSRMLGAWRARRLRVMEPWTNLRIIQSGGAFMDPDPSTSRDGGWGSGRPAAPLLSTGNALGQTSGRSNTLAHPGHSAAAISLHSYGPGCFQHSPVGSRTKNPNHLTHRPSGTREWRTFVEDVDGPEMLRDQNHLE